MRSNKYILTALLSVLAFAGSALSGIAHSATFIYELSNHPESGGPPNPGVVSDFGLRLDGLLTGNADETYIFDFDHASSNMFLVYDDVAMTMTISGTAYGYENNDLDGSEVGGTGAVWDINFVYNNVMMDTNSGGLPEFVVGPGGTEHVNFGTVSSSFGLFDLRDHYAPDPYDGTFLFGDDPRVSQLTGLLTGWGWLDYCPPGRDCSRDGWLGSDMNTSEFPPYPWTADWLFEATLVPVPAAVWLFGSGLIGLIGVARRRK